jgi:hypothetical protein
MGHQRIGTLPATRRWAEVVALLSGGAAAPDIASAIARATNSDIERIKRSETLRLVMQLMVALPLAARSRDFVTAAGEMGVEVAGPLEPLSIFSALSERLDRQVMADRDTSDVPELLRKALVEGFMAALPPARNGLFGDFYSADECQARVASLAAPGGFSKLVTAVFGRLIELHHSHYVGRVLGDDAVLGSRTQSIRDHSGFDRALADHSRETTTIIEEYAVGWYGKAFRDNALNDVRRQREFSNYALDKLHSELKVRSLEPADG